MIEKEEVNKKIVFITITLVVFYIWLNYFLQFIYLPTKELNIDLTHYSSIYALYQIFTWLSFTIQVIPVGLFLSYYQYNSRTCLYTSRLCYLFSIIAFVSLFVTNTLNTYEYDSPYYSFYQAMVIIFSVFFSIIFLVLMVVFYHISYSIGLDLRVWRIKKNLID